MITPSDIGNIIYELCEYFDVERYQEGNIPQGEFTEERIVIYPKELNTAKIWNNTSVEVNYCVPDVNKMAQLERLQEISRLCHDYFRQCYGVYDETPYRIKWSNISIVKSETGRYHYVNCKLLFEILNTI